MQESPPAKLSEGVLDAMYANLADPRRRRIVTCLAEATTPVARETLLRRIAERELDSSADSTSDERVQRIYISTYHVDLPKLEDADIVATDDEWKTVERGDHFETALRLLPE